MALDPTAPLSRERMLGFAQAALEARGRDDLEQAVHYKSREVHDANFLELVQHCVVAGTELIELYSELKSRGAVSRTAAGDMIWSMKYAAARALGIPEIPFTAIDDLIGLLREALGDAGSQPYAAWQMEAFRHFVAGDFEQVRALVARLLPHVTQLNHLTQKMDCPACAFYDMARYLGPEATPEELEPVLQPVLSGRQRCAESPTLSQALWASALARAGRSEEARRAAERALRMPSANPASVPLAVVVARVDAARAQGDLPALREWVPALLQRMERVEDAYDRLWATVRAHGASAVMAGETAGERAADPTLARLADEAMGLARRLDARLARPRHVRETEESLRSGT